MSRDTAAAPKTTHLKPVESPAPEAKAPDTQQAAAAVNDAGKPKAGRRRLVLLGTVAVLALAAGGWAGGKYLASGRYMVSTDDAYVRAHNTTLASKISGYVASIPVEDNAQIRAGDVIATIDDGDYRLALEAARDKVATQEATVERIGRQVVAQDSSIAQAKAQLASAQAMAKKTQSEFARQQQLASRDFASKQAFEQAEAGRDQAAASVQSAQAAIDAATATRGVIEAQQREAAGTLAELKTAQAKAERDLSFTVIRAPVDGVVGNRAIQVGDFIQVGQRFASVVPLDRIYVDANFKETQLAKLKPGQPVSVSVDALPDHAIEGRVASLSPASGAVFSLLPPDNATGNFTKIVQRMPVRIEIPADIATQRLMRPGMSVVVSVNTKAATGSAVAALAQ